MANNKKLQFNDNLACQQPAICTDIAAILVVYTPPQTIKDTIRKILPQIDWLIIIDNGNNKQLGIWAQQQDNIIFWLTNPANGLAKAQNMGIDKARKLGANWVLLLDDDSIPSCDMVKNMRLYYEKLPPDKQKQIAVIGSYIDEVNLPKPPMYITPYMKVLFKRTSFGNKEALDNLLYVCSSGSLIPIQVIEKIGDMNENFFIYFIDTEFCLRARSNNMDIIAVKNAVLQHNIGQRSNHKLWLFSVSTTNHPPAARYLLARNRLYLWQNYYYTQTAFVIFDILRFHSEILRILLFETHKCAKIKATFTGIWHAICGKRQIPYSRLTP